MFSVCFPEEVPDYDVPMDLGDDTDGVTLPDTYMDDMDMIGTGRILDTALCGPYYAFDMFGVSMINTDDVILYDACTDVMDMIGTGIFWMLPHLGPDLLLMCLGFLCLSFMVMDFLLLILLMILLILLMILFLLRERPTETQHFFF